MVHILAKGAKKNKSPFFSDCQPFRLIDIQFVKKTGLSLLTASKTLSNINFNDITKQFSGFYINELIYKLIKEGSEDRALFDLYLTTMDNLLDEQKVERILRTFEMRLLTLLGYDFIEYLADNKFKEQQYRLNLQNMQFEKTEIKKGFDIFSCQFINSLGILTEKCFLENTKDLKRFSRLVFNFLLDGKEIKSRALFTTIK